MLCETCSKLSFQYTKKICIRCQAEVLNNISILCEQCSAKEKQCAACLKKIQNTSPSKYRYGGCGACKR